MAKFKFQIHACDTLRAIFVARITPHMILTLNEIVFFVVCLIIWHCGASSHVIFRPCKQIKKNLKCSFMWLCECDCQRTWFKSFISMISMLDALKLLGFTGFFPWLHYIILWLIYKYTRTNSKHISYAFWRTCSTMPSNLGPENHRTKICQHDIYTNIYTQILHKNHTRSLPFILWRLPY